MYLLVQNYVLRDLLLFYIMTLIGFTAILQRNTNSKISCNLLISNYSGFDTNLLYVYSIGINEYILA